MGIAGADEAAGAADAGAPDAGAPDADAAVGAADGAADGTTGAVDGTGDGDCADTAPEAAMTTASAATKRMSGRARRLGRSRGNLL